MTTQKFLEKVTKQLRREMTLNNETNSTINEKEFEVIQVWYCKTIQNHKGLFIVKNTTNNIIMPYFYECTYNGDKEEMYIDCYVKKI